MKVVLFLLDAFRYDYLSEENTPFLWSCQKQGKYIQRIIPSAGFCERTEIFTGLKPNESGYFTAIGYEPDKSPYRNDLLVKALGIGEIFLEKIQTVLPLSGLNIFYKKVLLRFFRKNFSANRLKPYQIPFYLLDKLNLTEDEYDHHQGSNMLPESIFLSLKQKGKIFFYNAFTGLGVPNNGTDLDRLELALQAFKEDDYSLTPIYISVMDSKGHQHGPHSPEIITCLKQLDTLLEKYTKEFLNHDPSTNFIFLGDHGMSEVTKIIDVKEHIQKLLSNRGYKYRKDYIFFLDSTLLRVWFLNDYTKDDVRKVLEEDNYLNDNGVVINQQIANQYSIPYPDKKYGDFAWWAKEGRLIFPDFFHNQYPLKGMHGYMPDVLSAQGTCIIFGKDVPNSELEKMDLSALYDIIKSLILKKNI
jgi:predicted AlkP superfamily pyrophosphatase or phosphodiesterase